MAEPFYCCAQCVATDRLGALAPVVEAAREQLDVDDRTELGNALLVLAEIAGRRTTLGQQITDTLLAPIPERAAREVARRADTRHPGGAMPAG